MISLFYLECFGLSCFAFQTLILPHCLCKKCISPGIEIESIGTLSCHGNAGPPNSSSPIVLGGVALQIHSHTHPVFFGTVNYLKLLFRLVASLIAVDKGQVLSFCGDWEVMKSFLA